MNNFSFFSFLKKSILESDCNSIILSFDNISLEVVNFLISSANEALNQNIIIDCENFLFEEFKTNLSMTFLGVTSRFWLINFDSLSDKKKITFFIKEYSGPHQIILIIKNDICEKFLNKKDFNNIYFIYTDSILSNIELDNILFYTNILSTKDLSVIANKNKIKFSIRSLIIFSQYYQVLGKNIDEFLKEFYFKIINNKNSIFSLTQYFYVKNKKPFYKLWIDLKEDYSEQFWISFWSEQIWKSYNYILLKEKNDYIIAKQIGNKLPFSFLQKDWKFVDIDKLIKSHSILLKIDYNLKNGGIIDSFEYFFQFFFSK